VTSDTRQDEAMGPVITPTIGAAYSGPVNSLNLLRLCLACTVIVTHCIGLGYRRTDVILGFTTPATLAVYGFFGISGYLIARSASDLSPGRFLWHRFLRIFPAFWVCLIITALLFGLIGWIHWSHPCGTACYYKAPSDPWSYISRNVWLKMNQLTIPGTLHTVSYWAVWNGSLWTLFYEFLCYLAIGFLAVIGLLRRPIALLAVAVGVWLAEVLITSVPAWNANFTGYHWWDETKMLTFLPVFLAGSIIYVHREKIPDSGWLAAGCVGLMFLFYLVPLGNGDVSFTLTRSDLSAPLLAYPMLWLGIHLPWPKIGARNDYSYGMYIFGYPIAQVLILWNVNHWGYVPYTIMTLLITAGFAMASWWLIERNALRLKNVGAGPRRAKVAPQPLYPVGELAEPPGDR